MGKILPCFSNSLPSYQVYIHLNYKHKIAKYPSQIPLGTIFEVWSAKEHDHAIFSNLI